MSCFRRAAPRPRGRAGDGDVDALLGTGSPVPPKGAIAKAIAAMARRAGRARRSSRSTSRRASTPIPAGPWRVRGRRCHRDVGPPSRACCMDGARDWAGRSRSPISEFPSRRLLEELGRAPSSRRPAGAAQRMGRRPLAASRTLSGTCSRSAARRARRAPSAMSALAALRTGAGLVTLAGRAHRCRARPSHPALMSAPLSGLGPLGPRRCTRCRGRRRKEALVMARGLRAGPKSRAGTGRWSRIRPGRPCSMPTP